MANLSTAPLNGSRFAVVVSHFAPLHAQLEREIYDRAARYDGVVLVLVSQPDCGAGLIGLSARNRYRYLREAFADDAAINPIKLIGPYPADGGGADGRDGRYESKQWFGRLQEVIRSAFVSDSVNEVLVETDIAGIDSVLHDVLPQTSAGDQWGVGAFIGGSEELQQAMREHPHNREYWPIINHAFRREFTSVVLVVGSASVGKTTMVTRLSKLYDAPVAVEYAREFEEQCNVDDDELTAFDYQRLILSKFGQNEAALASPANHGIVFLDTDAMVTRVYAERYLPVEEGAKLEATFDMVIAQERPELIMVLPPVTEYVDDGFRAMQWASDRYEFHKTLMRVLAESQYADRVVTIDGKTYAARDEQAIAAIRERTGFEPRPMASATR